MTMLKTTSLTKYAAALAVCAGAITSAAWLTAAPAAAVHAAASAAHAAVDGSIPSVVIVAKRLTPAEKAKMDRADVLAAGPTTVSAGSIDTDGLTGAAGI